MKAARKHELKVVAIGNSRGVRLPKALLARYRIGEVVVLEERRDGLLLHGKDAKLSWDDTFREMAKSEEDWSDLDPVLADGLERER